MAKVPFEPDAREEATIPPDRKIKAAMRWLEIELSAGPQPAGDLLKRGRAAGHRERTLQTAKERLRVKSQRVYGEGTLQRWMWELPLKKR